MDDPAISLPIATRTLTAAGFSITDFRRQPHHGEFLCERSDVFGATILYVIGIADEDGINADEVAQAQDFATQEGRTFILVSNHVQNDSLTWSEFLDVLGGPVPTWRALSDLYPTILKTLGANTLPPGMTGEAWKHFEDAVGDGLEFIFGHRVLHLGGQQRGQRVGDLITQTPDNRILLIDAKSTKNGFDVGGPELRPLVEYVKNQKARQRNGLPIGSVVVVANSFIQDHHRLRELNDEFLADTGFPLSFLESNVLVSMISDLKEDARIRNTLRWAHIFCSGGLITLEKFQKELTAAKKQSYPRE